MIAFLSENNQLKIHLHRFILQTEFSAN